MVTLSIIFIFCSLTQAADWGDNAELGKSEKELKRNEPLHKEPDNSGMISDMFLSSDDLFSELNNIWAKKDYKNDQVSLVQKEYVIKDNVSSTMELSPLPFIEMSDFANHTTHQPTSEDVGQNVNNHWLRFRVIMKNMKSLMMRMYDDDTSTGNDMAMFRLLDKLLEIGDRLNMINTIQNHFDPDLLSFLKNKWMLIEANLLENYPMLTSVLAIDVKNLFMTITTGLANQFGNVFHKQALEHLSELDYILQTMRSSGFKDSEIFDVFMLLGLPIEDLRATSNTLESEARSYGITSLFSRSSHEGGYGYKMMTKDPFIILAGLALAAFAAYLVYRLLTTTAMGRKKRSDSNDVLSIDLSDMPEAMTNFYRLLDNAEVLYGMSQKPDYNNKCSFSDSFNRLWKSFSVDKVSGSCIRRFLCQHIHDNKFRAVSSGMDLEQLALIGLAELLGEKGAGKTIDKYITKAIKDEEIDCPTEAESCDELKYASISTGIIYNGRPD